MIWTNHQNLPEPIAKAAIANEYYESGGDLSVSESIQSPRQFQLRKRHENEIFQDVSECLWKLLGSSVHYILEKGAPAGSEAERRLKTTVLGWVFTGKSDLYSPHTLILDDWKVTSTWSFALGEKEEWKRQILSYQFLHEANGRTVRQAFINAILRDWISSKAGGFSVAPLEAGRAVFEFKSLNRAKIEVRRMVKEEGKTINDYRIQRLCPPDYHASAFNRVEIDLMPYEVVKEMVYERVKLHQSHEKTPDDELPECSKDERWVRDEAWAVKKKGASRAINGGVCDSEAKALEVMAEQKDPIKYLIEHRPGTNVKCENYCLAAPFCNQYLKTLEG